VRKEVDKMYTIEYKKVVSVDFSKVFGKSRLSFYIAQSNVISSMVEGY